MASVIRGNDNFDSAGGAAMKAWVNFNGTGTVAIRAQYNVSSITDNGAGDYTVNFTTAMPDANYCTQVTAKRGTVNNDLVALLKASGTYTTSAVQVICVASSNYPTALDGDPVCVAIFR